MHFPCDKKGACCHWLADVWFAGGAGGCCIGGAGKDLPRNDMSDICHTISKFCVSLLLTGGGCEVAVLGSNLASTVVLVSCDDATSLVPGGGCNAAAAMVVEALCCPVACCVDCCCADETMLPLPATVRMDRFLGCVSLNHSCLRIPGEQT